MNAFDRLGQDALVHLITIDATAVDRAAEIRSDQ